MHGALFFRESKVPLITCEVVLGQKLLNKKSLALRRSLKSSIHVKGNQIVTLNSETRAP